VFTLGNLIIGLSSVFIIFIAVGAILDLKKFQQIKLDNEERDKKLAEARTRNRRKRREV
jgi:hypothetical protein